MATGTQNAGTLTVHPDGGAVSLAFSPDGRTLAAGVSDGTAGTVQLFDAATGQQISAEWSRYAPGLSYQDICA